MAAARIVLVAAIAASICAACTDGTTPDCSDAAEMCAPSYGEGGPSESDAPSATDAGSDTSAPAVDAAADAAGDSGAPG